MWDKTGEDGKETSGELPETIPTLERKVSYDWWEMKKRRGVSRGLD